MGIESCFAKQVVKVEVNRPCVICGATGEERVLFSLDFPDAKYPGEFLLKQCSGCGIIFNSPRLEGAALSQLYEADYYVFLERPRDSLHRVASLHNATVRELLRITQLTTSDVLEVGCAKGYLLALLREAGWRVQGVELSESAASFARDELGIDVFNGTVEAFARIDRERGFPFVFTTDVIEHVPDPRTFVQALASLVAPNGLLLVSTPNGAAAGMRKHGPMWGGFNPFHIWFFDHRNLSKLLNEHGFEVVESYTYGNLLCSERRSPDALKARIRRLLPPGILNAIRHLRYRAKDAFDGGRQSPRQLVCQTYQEISNQVPFHETEDGQDALRHAHAGENLVVIARRVGNGE